ncbi:MAG: hypothetical protein PUE47_04935, partial [Lachnospiraceae bacterium]|nr:hypothetical protein [Lachnospiraceae bacterium]
TRKTDLLDNEYDTIKFEVFSALSKFFHFELFSRRIVQPSYIIYASNIDSFDNISSQFLESIGMQSGDGKDIPSFPVYFNSYPDEDTIGYEHSFDFETNRYIIYFEKRVKLSSVYQNPEHQIISIFSDLYRTFSRYDYKGYLYYEYRDSIISFRDEISHVKENGRSYKKILKIRNQFYKEINFYQNIAKIGNAYQGEVKAADSLPWIGRFHICGICTNYMNRSIKRLNSYYNSVRREMNEKIELCKDLSDKRQISKSNAVSLIALVVAALTLFVTIYGDEVKQLMDLLKTFISNL